MNRLDAEKAARRAKIAEEITLALEKSGMTRKEFAEKMHRVPSEVTRWLCGSHNFTSDLLAEISYVLKEPISGIYGKKTDNINDLGLSQEILDSIQEQANCEGKSLNEYIREIIIRTASEKQYSAMDFCGVWTDGYPDADEIRASRTLNTIEEL